MMPSSLWGKTMSKQKHLRVRAFTLIEMLVVIAVISILTAILLPVFANVREKGRRTACMSNMRQIEMALTAYTQDNEGQFPTGNQFHRDWSLAVFHYVNSAELFQCPDVQLPLAWSSPDIYFYGSATRGYALNKALNTLDYSDPEFVFETGLAIGRVPLPAATVALAESGYRAEAEVSGQSTAYENANTLSGPESLGSLAPGETWYGPPGGERHGGGCNYAFVDGHVHWYTPAQVLNSSKPNNGTQPSFAL